jgi:hypothetical protein
VHIEAWHQASAHLPSLPVLVVGCVDLAVTCNSAASIHFLTFTCTLGAPDVLMRNKHVSHDSAILC